MNRLRKMLAAMAGAINKSAEKIATRSDGQINRPRLETIKMRSYTGLAWAVQLLGLSIFSFFAYAFIGIWLQKFGLPLWVVMLGIFAPATIGWAWVLFKTPMFRWWFISNGPMEACVVGRQFAKDRIVQGNNSGPLKNFDASTLREIGPNWLHGKLPWEVLVDKRINLEANILIGNDIKTDPLIITSSDGAPIHIGWQTMLKALRGYLVNHIQYSNESQIQEFRAKFIQFWRSWGITMKATDILHGLPEDEFAGLYIKFKSLLSGPNIIDKFEKLRGTDSGNPEALAVELDKRIRDALETPLISGLMGKGAAAIINELPKEMQSGVNPNIAIMLAAANAGTVAGFEPIVLVGAESLGQGGLATLQSLRTQKGSKTKN